MKVKSGYDASVSDYRNPRDVREMIEWCSTHNHVEFLDIKGNMRIAKVNGKVRTWRRDPSRIEVPLKYGMYEYAVFTASDIARVLIPL